MPTADNNPLNNEQLMHAMSMDDAYRIERVLGKGTGGVTELVTIDGSGPFVRKKIPREQARRMVWAALAECESRYLPKLLASYELPERFVVVLDFVAGETLESHLGKRGALPESEACRLISNICEAAGELHAHGVIHRDISPVNIIVSPDGAHLIDLGISRVGGTGATHDTLPFGTAGFAAPEQYGFAETDVRSDVYSIGRVLGYMLTGVNPKDDRYDAIVADGTTLSASMRDIVWKACSFEPSARFQSAAEFARAIAAASGEGDAPVATGDGERSGRREADEGMSASAAATPAAPATSAGDDAATLGEGLTPGVSPADAAGASGMTKVADSYEAAASVAARAATRKRAAWKRAAIIAGASVLAVVVLAVCAGLALRGAGQSALDDGAQGDSAVSQAQSAEPTGDEGGASANEANGSATAAPAASDISFEVAESGWTVSSPESGSYVIYAFALRNPSDDFMIKYPSVKITGRDKDGTVLFSDEQVLNVLYPGKTTYFASLAGGNSVPATVEFTPCAPDEWNVTPYAGATPQFEVSGLSAVPDGFGGVNFTGELTVVSAEGSDAAISSGLAVTAVLRDDDGKIVGGFSDFIDMPAEGETAPFEVSYFDPPAYASAEAYVQVW